MRLICESVTVKESMNHPTDMAKIYDDHSVRLYNMSLRIVADRFEAEEVMHDTLIQYHSLEDKSVIQDLRKWLSSICIRKSIDRLRKRRRFRDFLEEYEEPVSIEVEEPDYELDVVRIRKALVRLPDSYRLMISLHLFEGYDYQEISQITGIKEVTVRSTFLRARRKLVEMLNNMPWTD